MTAPVRPMARMLRHDVWATTRLIGHCRELTDAQLDLTVLGTFGTIRRTLAHIVGADQSYIRRLVGDFGSGGELDDEKDLPLDEIATAMRGVGDAVERFIAGPDFDPERPLPRRDRGTVPAWALVAQLVHHGSDHRAQIGTILGAHGLEVPDLDVWTYVESPDLASS